MFPKLLWRFHPFCFGISLETFQTGAIRSSHGPHYPRPILPPVFPRLPGTVKHELDGAIATNQLMNQQCGRITTGKTDNSGRVKGLRVALFSGNYNCVRDGANQALNRLVGFLEKSGAEVRVFSPTSKTPAFDPAGKLYSVPSVSIPRRREYRVAAPLPRHFQADLEAFRPDVIQISAPDILGCSALRFAEKRGIPTVASVHTRFETYFKYYGLGWVEGLTQRYMSWIYNRCQHVYVPSKCMADILRDYGVRSDIRYWSRGVEHDRFKPGRRDMAWRRSLGFADDQPVVAFVGRVVMEKGLAPFAEAVDGLTEKGLKFGVLVVGAGPARSWFEQRLPDAVFTGALFGTDLARAYASSEIFFNPSTTEAFGNVNLEALASGIPVVSARASGSSSIIEHGKTGFLVDPEDDGGFGRALAQLIQDTDLRDRMGAAGVQVSYRYHWDDILNEVVGHYFSAIEAFQAEKDMTPSRRRFAPSVFERPGMSK